MWSWWGKQEIGFIDHWYTPEQGDPVINTLDKQDLYYCFVYIAEKKGQLSVLNFQEKRITYYQANHCVSQIQFLHNRKLLIFLLFNGGKDIR
jgi:hypothetical protein